MIQNKDAVSTTKHASLHSFSQHGKNYELIIETKRGCLRQCRFVTLIIGTIDMNLTDEKKDYNKSVHRSPFYECVYGN